MVNAWFPARSIYGFEMVDAPRDTSGVVNQIFTSNRIVQIRMEISRALSQCKHLRFIDGC
jgi:hypothetical protein